MGKKKHQHHSHAGRSSHRDDEEEGHALEVSKLDASPSTSEVEAAADRSVAAETAAPVAVSPPSRTSEDGERRASGETAGEAPVDPSVLKQVEPSPSTELIQGGSSGVSTVEEAPLVPSGAESPLPLPPTEAESAAATAAEPAPGPLASDSEQEEEEAFRESLTKPPAEEPSALSEITQVLVFRIAVAVVALALRACRYVVSRPLVVKGAGIVTGHASFPPVRDAAVQYANAGLSRVQPYLERVERLAPKQIHQAVEFSTDVYTEAVRMLEQAAQPETEKPAQ